ncbi:MAG TPA: DJ-1/PfpI family protein [Bryobacteraceae bacterium]|nr:DJ-1/PfpI family protein [Bryobacteraceae bacterium]
MKLKTLIPIGDAAEAMDTLYPYYRMREAGYEVVVAGPEKRVYPLVAHEIPPGWDITLEIASYHLASDAAFRDVDPEDYIGLFLTGGRAPEYIRYDKDLIRIVRHFFEAGKPVAVVCHGAEIVAAARVIDGRRMATVPKCQLDIELCGATFVNDGCVRSGNMVSGRTWHDQHLYMGEFIRMLEEARASVGGGKATLLPV